MRAVLAVPLSVVVLAVVGCSASPAPAGGPGGVTAARIVWHLPTVGAPVSPSTLGEAPARALMQAVDAAPGRPAGVYNCPMDDGSTAQITFLRSGHAVASVTARLTGCADVAGRTMPAAVASILRDAGPPGLRVFSTG